MCDTAQTAAKFWPGTSTKRSTGNAFDRPAGPAIPAKVRSDRQIASDEQRRMFGLASKKPPKDRKPRKTVAQLLAPARNQISITSPAESAKTARIKRVSF